MTQKLRGWQGRGVMVNRGGEISFRCTKSGYSSHTLREKNTEDAGGNQPNINVSQDTNRHSHSQNHGRHEMIAQQQGNKRKGLFIFKSLSWFHPGIWSLVINFFITSSLVKIVLLTKAKRNKTTGKFSKVPYLPICRQRSPFIRAWGQVLDLPSASQVFLPPCRWECLYCEPRYLCTGVGDGHRSF